MYTHEFRPFKGGVAVFCEEMARAAASLGHAVTVLTRFPAPAPGLAPGCEVRDVSLGQPPGWRLRAATAAHMAARRGDTRHGILYLPEQHAIRAALALEALGLLPRRRLIITLHGSEIHRFAASAATRRRFASLARRAERITVLSRYCRDLAEDRFPACRGKVLVTPGAPRSRGLCAATASRRREDGPTVLLTVARLHPRKGQAAVVEALGALPEKLRSRLRYRAVGPVVDAGYHARLVERARALGVALETPGEVADEALAECYAGADLFVLASESDGRSVEGFGLVYLEAGAAGLPVIAHRTGGVEDAVRDGETGLVVEPGDPRALGEAIARLAADAGLRRRLGEAGRARAAGLSWLECAAATFA